MTVHPTPYFRISLRIDRRDSAYVTVLAPLYVRKEWVMEHCYSLDFTDAEILTDPYLLEILAHRYGDH